MPHFPYCKSAAVHVFDILTPDNTKAFALIDLRNAMEENFLPMRVPDLHKPLPEGGSIGWFYLDGEGPVVGSPFCAIGLRMHTKKAPGQTVAALTADRCAQWCADEGAERCPTSIRKETRAQVVHELEVQAIPRFREDVVVFDWNDRRVLLFGGAESHRDFIKKRLTTLLRAVTSQDVALREYTLHSHLLESRPEAYLPGGLGNRFMGWVIDKAERQMELVVTTDDGTSVDRFHISLGDKVVATVPGGLATVTGGEAVDTFIMDQSESENPATYKRVDLHIEDENDNSYDVQIDSEGRLLKCSPCKALTSMVESGGDWESNTTLAGEIFDAAQRIVGHIIGSFDSIELARIMEEQPQHQLWQVDPLEGYAWEEGGLRRKPASGPLIDAAKAAVKAMGPDVTVSLSVGGKEVTL